MKTYLAFALVLIFISCSKSNSDSSDEPSSADLAKFIGTWAGSYSCPGGVETLDTLIISPGNNELELNIIIHAGYFNPDTVLGELTEPNLILVSEQSMGGVPGTAQITSQGAQLKYYQTGFGITCGGTNYTQVPGL
jgi:hypothetical protein